MQDELNKDVMIKRFTKLAGERFLESTLIIAYSLHSMGVPTRYIMKASMADLRKVALRIIKINEDLVEQIDAIKAYDCPKTSKYELGRLMIEVKEYKNSTGISN